MKKAFYGLIAALVLCVFLFTACGSQENDYSVYWMEEEYLFSPKIASRAYQLMGVQFHGGKAVQLWGRRKVDAKLQSVLDVYVYSEDQTNELLVEGMPPEYYGNWFWDEEGNYYILLQNEIIKLDSEGNLIYSRTGVDWLWDICQMTDGTLMMLVLDEDNNVKLGKLDPETGAISKYEDIRLERRLQYISGARDGLYLMDSDGIWEVDLETGGKDCVMIFDGADYSLDSGVTDFRVSGGAAEILTGEMPYVKNELVPRDAESRTPIVVRDWDIDQKMLQCVNYFNRTSDDYYVVLEACTDQVNLQYFRERTGAELVVGDGPDIVCSDALSDVLALMDRGIFEDLRPYMERDGIKESDFYGSTFDCWADGEKVYGVNTEIEAQGLWVERELLKGRKASDIEILVDALLEYKKTAIFKRTWDSKEVLEYFLTASESLGGTVDWENGTCDFSGELFLKMLKAAKQYGESRVSSAPVLADFKEEGYYNLETISELNTQGKVYVGYFFDDGTHAINNLYNVLAINSSSPNKEGAWEFIKVLLSEEVQISWPDSYVTYPVNKNSFEMLVQAQIVEGPIELGIDYTKYKKILEDPRAYDFFINSQGTVEVTYNLTEAKIKEIREMLMDIRALPIRNSVILDIVLEEAQSYFDDSAGIDDVCKTIESKVTIYLEMKK